MTEFLSLGEIMLRLKSPVHERFFQSPQLEATFGGGEANVAAGIPLRREGNAMEVADLVAYLASDESSFLTGTSIDINGGLFCS